MSLLKTTFRTSGSFLDHNEGPEIFGKCQMLNVINILTGLDETTFFETETRPIPGPSKILRPRRDQDNILSNFWDRDETENSAKWFLRDRDRQPWKMILRDRDETETRNFKLFIKFLNPSETETYSYDDVKPVCSEKSYISCAFLFPSLPCWSRNAKKSNKKGG